MATNTYVALDKKTVTSDVASIEFTSITGTYTDLVLVASVKGSTNDVEILVQFNSDTGSNYSQTFMYGTGSAAGSQRQTSQTAMRIGSGNSNTNFDTYIANIQNYSNSTTYKTVISREASAGILVSATTGLWRSTSAITSILVKRGGGNLVTGSTFSLYGIKAQPAFTAKATGGTITYDIGYTYHTFTSSGTFTPSQALAIDTLVIAGGGAGGYQIGGGGGAGGVVYTSGSNVTTSTAYTVTVGAGGAQTTSGSTRNSGSDSNVTGTGLSLTAAVGGGGGGAFATPRAGLTGGSGGGAASMGSLGSGTSGQGTSGGDGYQSQTIFIGGGGGGATAAGANGVDGQPHGSAGGGGTSAYSSWGAVTSTGQLVGSTRYYAGGGGGGTFRDQNDILRNVGAGGNGGGGAGGAGANNNTQTLPVAGTANTGGGGGGSGAYGYATQNGFAGGSGIVIIRYAN